MRIKTFSTHETTQLAVVVRVKTFSTHVVAQIRSVVSKSGVFTHERIAVIVSMVTTRTPLHFLAWVRSAYCNFPNSFLILKNCCAINFHEI